MLLAQIGACLSTSLFCAVAGSSQARGFDQFRHTDRRRLTAINARCDRLWTQDNVIESERGIVGEARRWIEHVDPCAPCAPALCLASGADKLVLQGDAVKYC